MDKIYHLQATVRDRTKPVEERRFALRFLIDLVEDLHQPLHVGDDIRCILNVVKKRKRAIRTHHKKAASGWFPRQKSEN